MTTNMMRMVLTTVLAAGMLAGCNDEPTKPAGEAPPEGLVLTAEPADAKDIVAALAEAKDGDTVTVRGRVGGSKKPFVETRAVMGLVDMSRKYCGQGGTGDSCTEPWDYCCERELGKYMVSVQVNGADGKMLHKGLKGVGKVKELSEVVVKGVLKIDAGGAKIIHATGFYVVPQ